MPHSQIHRILSRDRDASRYISLEFSHQTKYLFQKNVLPLVANTDTRDQEGSHWLAMYIKDKDTLEFFDSYGLPPEMYGVHISNTEPRNPYQSQTIFPVQIRGLPPSCLHAPQPPGATGSTVPEPVYFNY
ncbi:hypothetical protein TNCV_1940101 [Trichonephila clavipes]|nr:hypothetical protein TNCV_1940101 [Trichonephila clavipes]